MVKKLEEESKIAISPTYNGRRIYSYVEAFEASKE